MVLPVAAAVVVVAEAVSIVLSVRMVPEMPVEVVAEALLQVILVKGLMEVDPPSEFLFAIMVIWDI